jgi:intracellular sulfur oxidation DsrE/DsrF family protein
MYNMLLDAKIKAYACGDSLSAYELKKRHLWRGGSHKIKLKSLKYDVCVQFNGKTCFIS